jgi:hypothetical protein
MNIDNENKLHLILDEMISKFPKNKKIEEIAICRSFIKHDKNLEINSNYKGIPITIYAEWFADGTIAMR